MAIGSVVATINNKSKNLVNPEVYVLSFDAEKNEFGTSVGFQLNLTSDELVASLRKTVRYGEFFFLFLSKEAVAYYGDLSTDFEQLFGVIRYTEALDHADADYWMFARRGDMTFVPREGIEPRTGRNVAIEVHTSLFEQYGDDGLLFTPITFAGKKAGTVAPKAHRLLTRLTPLKTEPLTSIGEEVDQEAYNVLIRPDMEGVIYDSVNILDENFIGSDIVTATLPTGFFMGNTGEAKSTISTVGARQFLGHLLLGPSAMDFSALSSLIENAEPPESGFEAPITTHPVAQKNIGDATGFVAETRFFTTQLASGGSGDDILGKRMCFSAYRNSEHTKLTWGDGLGVTLRPTLMVDGLPAAEDQEDNVFIFDNSTGRGGSQLASTRFVIKPETYYNIRMLFNESVDSSANGAITLSVWIWEDGKTATGAPQLQIGSYVPTNRRMDVFAGNDTDQSSGVGFGCESLSYGEYWAFDHLTVRNTSTDYAQMVLDLDMVGQHEKVDFLMTLRGKGFSAGAEVYGHSVLLWNFSSEAWEEVQRNSYDEYRLNTVRFSVDLLPEYLSGSHIYFLITAPYPQQSTPLASAISSRVELDYVYGRSVGTAKKTFGKSDIYFVQTPDVSAIWGGTVAAFRPSIRQSLIIASSSNINTLQPGTNYEDENGAPTALSGPIEEVLEVALMQELDGHSPKYQLLDVLRHGADYMFFWNNPTLRGSMQEQLALVLHADFSGQPIRVTLRSHSRVNSVNEFLQTAGSRKLDSDLLARHKKSVFVDINAQYKGVVSGNLTEKLREWVFNFSSQEIQSSDISRFLLDQGVTQILLFDGSNSTSALNLVARRINDNGVVQKESSQVLLRRTATETFVPGVVKLISIA